RQIGSTIGSGEVAELLAGGAQGPFHRLPALGPGLPAGLLHRFPVVFRGIQQRFLVGAGRVLVGRAHPESFLVRAMTALFYPPGDRETVSRPRAAAPRRSPPGRRRWRAAGRRRWTAAARGSPTRRSRPRRPGAAGWPRPAGPAGPARAPGPPPAPAGAGAPPPTPRASTRPATPGAAAARRARRVCGGPAPWRS